MKQTTVAIIGAGPGGLAVAAALQDNKIDFVILESGEVGQSWLIYPADTHLLSESTERKGHHDENMIAGIATSKVFPNIPHPNHIMYQKYLQYVVDTRKIPVQEHTEVKSVIFNPDQNEFLLTTRQNDQLLAKFVVWAAGMYSTPNEDMDCTGAYIHYAHMPYLDEIDEPEVTVVGSANGASSVVLEVAKPGRLVNLVVSKKYEIPLPIDCLWKEQMSFIKELEKQGLVKIIENFRVKRIYDLPYTLKDTLPHKKKYVLESEEGEKSVVKSRPIVCTGFLPNVGPIKEMIDVVHQDHDTLLDLDKAHQSKKQPKLYVAGAMGKLDHESGFIRFFRDFGKVIADDIQKKM